MTPKIAPYESGHRDEILALSLRAWTPVFAKLELAVMPYIFSAFYPEGWSVRQLTDIARFLHEERQNAFVASVNDVIVGWVGFRVHPTESMGEIYMLAVDPSAQRQGVATALLTQSVERFRAAGMELCASAATGR